MDPFYFTPHPFLWRWSEDWGIRYYGLAYVLGFVGLWFGLRFFQKKGWSQLKPGEESDLLTWVVMGVLLGGRLGYCFLYDWNHTVEDPLSIIAFWRQGGISGMASHGGFVGVIVALWLYCRKQGYAFWALADQAAILTPIGLFFGRIANFLNGELWGRPGDVPWAVVFANDPMAVARHPSQVYEALGEGLLLFLLMLGLRFYFSGEKKGASGANGRKALPAGTLSLMFLCFYSLARILCECFREPDPQIGYYWRGVTQGQILSVLLMVLAGVLAWFRGRSSAVKMK